MIMTTKKSDKNIAMYAPKEEERQQRHRPRWKDAEDGDRSIWLVLVMTIDHDDCERQSLVVDTTFEWKGFVENLRDVWSPYIGNPSVNSYWEKQSKKGLVVSLIRYCEAGNENVHMCTVIFIPYKLKKKPLWSEALLVHCRGQIYQEGWRRHSWEFFIWIYLILYLKWFNFAF